MTYTTMPDIDDNNLDKEIEAIAEADGNILQQIAMLTHGSNWHEKMALATNAIERLTTLTLSSA